MVKHFYKRVIAGILSVITAVTMVPVSVFADDVDDTSLTTAEEIQEYLELLQYLETIGSNYAFPAIMITEGDTVYVDDYAIASTTVPITKSLVNDQTKVKTQYWLDSMRIGDAAALKADETALVAYFSSNIGAYDAIKVRLEQQLIALRDYCIANGITKQGLWDDAEQMMYAYAAYICM